VKKNNLQFKISAKTKEEFLEYLNRDFPESTRERQFQKFWEAYKRSFAVITLDPENLPACNHRIAHEGQYYCCIKAPRAIKLVSLDVCKACKSKKWQLPTQKQPKKEYARNEWNDPLESYTPSNNQGKVVR